MQPNYKVISIFDTETTNVGEGSNTRAFCILYTFNDLRNISICDYVPDVNDDFRLFRTEKEAILYIEDVINYGIEKEIVPIICGYNLMFDLQTLMEWLCNTYTLKINAQSGTNVYTIDVYNGKDNILRFWDTYNLEMRGLAAMGDICGLKKAKGDWNYKLIRSNDTLLTDKEVYYATRDVQVIPAYLCYLFKSNNFIKENDFGCKILTKTSIVRTMAQRTLGNYKVTQKSGKRISIYKLFMSICKRNLPKTYDEYAVSKACFRGGLTFTSALTANKIVENVASIDVTSMHHAFINGRRVPTFFSKVDRETLQNICFKIKNTTVNEVLANYDNPFGFAFDACIHFDNLRLKKNSCFSEWGIGILSSAKFRGNAMGEKELNENDLNREAELSMKRNGYHDTAIDPIFSLGKLFSCKMCKLFLSEIEFWNLCQVYDFDSFTVIGGYLSVKTILPPDYITLQSNKLFKMKTEAKQIDTNYIEGVPYKQKIGDTIPDNFKESLLNGTCNSDLFHSWYTSTIKGMFNGIYGTQAQDIFKPSFCIDDYSIRVDKTTVLNDSNFLYKIPKNVKVMYQYGLRIVAGSRMHLIIAMILLYSTFGDRVIVTGGDTDSLKISCKKDVTNDEILKCLKPLHNAITISIATCMKRLKLIYPKEASDLKNVGIFDIEKCGSTDRYFKHIELWNKARISVDSDLNFHVTCAGLSRPSKKYNIENALKDLSKDYGIDKVLNRCLGYNSFVDKSLSYALESYRPKATDYIDINIVDYTGKKCHVKQHECIALYNTGRYLGELTKFTNVKSFEYIKNEYNREPYNKERTLGLNNGVPYLMDSFGNNLLEDD